MSRRADAARALGGRTTHTTMARTCGIRIGPKRFELVVLEGGAKKHKVVATARGELPRDGDESAAAKVLRDALAAAKAPVDDVMVAIDIGLGAFRTHKVQLSDRAKIEETLKYDVEGEFPHLAIDDAVVDFEQLDNAGDTSQLLVSAVKKEDVRRVVDLLAKAGAEPMEVELEGSAVYNAANAAGLLVADKAQVLVHVGEHSTCVVIVDGGKLREVRAIPFGAHGAATAAPAAGAEGEPAPAVGADEQQRRLIVAATRIRRELARSVAAARTANPLDDVLVCGLGAKSLLGEPILDCEVKLLEVFGAETGAPDSDPAEHVVAYGAAVRQLGGGAIKASLRREELRYSGTWERLELPLMVLSLLVVLGMGVWYRGLLDDTHALKADLVFWRDSARNLLVPEAKSARVGNLAKPSPDFLKLVEGFKNPANEALPNEQIDAMQRMIMAEVAKMKKDLGRDAEMVQPQSALTGMAAVLGVLQAESGRGTRPSLRKLSATYQQGKQGKGDFVRVTMDLTFFADDVVLATEHFEALKRTLREQPWFLALDDKNPTKPLETSQGMSITGLVVDVDCTKIPAGNS